MATAQKEKIEWAKPPENYYLELFGEDKGKVFQDLINDYQKRRNQGESHLSASRNAIQNKNIDDRTKFEFYLFVNELNRSKKPDYNYLKDVIIASRGLSIEPKENETEIGRATEYARLAKEAHTIAREQQAQKHMAMTSDERKQEIMKSVPTITPQKAKVTESTKNGYEITFKVGGQTLVAFVSDPKVQLEGKTSINREEAIELVKKSDYIIAPFERVVVNERGPKTETTFGAMSKKNIADVLERNAPYEFIGIEKKEISTKESKKYYRE